MKTEFDVVIVGGGAAGFFAAVELSARAPGLKVVIVEKTTKLLAKVRISGGGRCNVTHACFDPTQLSKHYPRGGKFLRQPFRRFGPAETVKWFGTRGVELKTEEDGRMFPVTDSSATITDCLTAAVAHAGIAVQTGAGVEKIVRDHGSGWVVHLSSGRRITASRVLVAAGGNPHPGAYGWLALLGHRLAQPVPSLFTFNDRDKKFSDLMGIAVGDAEVSIAGTKHRSRGPLLITHWGLSGPSVLRLSAWAALLLAEMNYTFTALVNWTGEVKEEDMRVFLRDYKSANGSRTVMANPLFSLPARLWVRLCAEAEISRDKIWSELPQRNMNKLLENLIRCPFNIRGKTTFKEEFVTCGGVVLEDVDPDTLESKVCPGLFFAGEVLNMDGETGGFNFQAAWTTAYLAAHGIVRSLSLNGRGS